MSILSERVAAWATRVEPHLAPWRERVTTRLLPGIIAAVERFLIWIQPFLAKLGPLGRAAADWLAIPEHSQRIGMGVAAVLVVLALNLPPFSLFTRLTTLDYATLEAGRDARVPAASGDAALNVSRHNVLRSTRVKLQAISDFPRGVGALPSGYESLGSRFKLDVNGTPPKEATLSVGLPATVDEQPFIDPFGWDGKEWIWLASRFVSQDRLEIYLPLSKFVPQVVVTTRATQSATKVSAVLLPPPAAPPAAMAELPVLEMAAYYLTKDDGSIAGKPFPVPSRKAELYGVISNREGNRLRTDLVANILIDPASRLRHRDAIVALVQRDKLRGVVLDYRGLDSDLQAGYADWLKRLADDLHAINAGLVVAVPMPDASGSDWSDAGYNWRNLGTKVDGLRILLPADAPLELTKLDSMIRWALKMVDRRRLQLAIPVRGRDIVDNETTPIGFGQAFGHVLDMASSDAPGRITPGQSVQLEMPQLRSAELGRDPATGMWRFYYWDANRRKHTVWLNDAAGMQPAFEMAVRYRIARLALDGVEAGLDPALWTMVKTFIAKGIAQAPTSGDYRIQWQLVDSTGQVVQETLQPLALASFDLQAPRQMGSYNLSVNLVTEGNQLAAVGQPSTVSVALPPPPTPTPSPIIIYIPDTPEAIVTAPAPLDEQRINRAPVGFATAESTVEVGLYDGMVNFAAALLRAGPSITYTAISDLRIGERFVLEEAPQEGDQWLHIRMVGTGVEGWVLAQTVTLGTPTPTPSPAPAASPVPTARRTATPSRSQGSPTARPAPTPTIR